MGCTEQTSKEAGPSTVFGAQALVYAALACLEMGDSANAAIHAHTAFSVASVIWLATRGGAMLGYHQRVALGT